MRFMTLLVLGGALALSACSDGDGTGGGAGTGGSAGAGGNDGGTPTIIEVSWEPEPECTNGVQSNVVITVLAEDPDTLPEDLIYTGSVTRCDGPLNAAVSTISCTNLAPYAGTVMVMALSDPLDTSSMSSCPFSS